MDYKQQLINEIKQYYFDVGFTLSNHDIQTLNKMDGETLERLWYNTTPSDFLERANIDLVDYTDELTPYQQRRYLGQKPLKRFDANAFAPAIDGAYTKPTNLKPLAGNITKNTVRGGMHLVPIVGAGLTAMDIYQGLSQPVSAGTLDWNQMSPEQQQQRIEGYKQVQDIINNVQARQRVQEQYRQNQADMIRKARFGI